MTNSAVGPAAGPTTLVFQAPPSLPQDDTDDDIVDEVLAPPTDNRGGRASSDTGSTSPLRMLKGARAAATGMHISDAQIRAVLDDPEEVEPDPTQPNRNQLRRDGIVVTTGNDGMILRVSRRR